MDKSVFESLLGRQPGVWISNGEDWYINIYRESVLVSSGCCNKFHRLGGLNNRYLLLIVSAAGKTKVGCWPFGSW